MDRISKKQRSELMSRIRSRDTKPEVLLRKALWHSGLRYRKYYGPENVDIAFPGKRVAVFVDGCFWHSCPIHGHMPKSSTAYWAAKLEKNTKRAYAKDSRLQEAGWQTLHFWEHEVCSNIDGCIYEIAEVLGSS